MGATDDPHVPACRFHWRIQPVVIGPDEIPRIDDLEVAARMPELAALSAIVHGSRADGVRVVETAITALASLDDPNGAHYLDLVLSSLRPAARAAMEKLMTQRDYRYRVDWLRKANEEGREEGLEKGLLREARRALDLVLGARGISLSDVGRARVEACEDVATIERWLARAVTVSGEDDLFVTD